MKNINDRIINLWKSTPDEYINRRMPFLLNKIKKNSIIFIGINPSFSEKGFTKSLEKSQYSKLDIKEFYTFPQSPIFDIETSLKIEEETKGNYPYFNKFKELAKSINTHWNHIDLFYIRETSQNNLNKYIFSKNLELNNFAEEQLKITKTVLEQAEPKILVVANALASTIFKREYESKFDEIYGCYFTEIRGKMVPTFLSSMVTGQRALDNYSYERLCWHIVLSPLSRQVS